MSDDQWVISEKLIAGILKVTGEQWIAAILHAAAKRTDLIQGVALPTTHGEQWIYTDDAVVKWLQGLAHTLAEESEEL